MAKAAKTKKKRDPKLLLAALASGALYALAFPPLNLFLLVLVALVPWLVALKNTNPWGGFKSGFVFGVVFWGTQMFWLVPFVQKWTGSYVTASIPYIAILLLPPLCFALTGLALQKCIATGRTWMIPLVWAGMEWARSSVPFLRFPWGLIGLPMANAPELIQGAAIGTIFLVSAWAVLVNVVLVDIALKAKPIRVFRSLMIAVGVGFGSYLWYANAPQGTTKMLVGAGQPGVDLAYSDKAGQETELVTRVQSLYDTANAQKLDLVVFPEALFSIKKPEDIKNLISWGETPAIIGATRADDERHYQSALSVANNQVLVSDKTELVIFGEYVPLRDQLPLLNQFNLPSGDLSPGDHPNVLTAGKLKVGPVLCFEALFPNVSGYMADHNAQVLAVQSIDDWYKGTWCPEQLELSARFRAVESQLPVIRAATTGTTMFISMHGKPFPKIAEPGKQELISAEMVVPERSVAFAGRIYFGWVGAAFWLIAFVMPLPKKKAAA